MPEEDHKEIRRRIERRQLTRFSLIEIVILTTIVSIALGISTWAPLWLVGLLLGAATTLFLFSIVRAGLQSRVAKICFGTLLMIYIVVAIIAYLRV